MVQNDDQKMASTSQLACATLLKTSSALIDQFTNSVETVTSADAPIVLPEHPSPLPLLIAAGSTLRATTTKLSLLTITPPFTESAVASLLSPLNESILPSLVTASLLTNPNNYPESFCSECRALTKHILRELKSLLNLVEKRSKDGKSISEISAADKQEVTEATGRVWEACDRITKFAEDGVVGHIVKKANQWLALMKDAVQELQEWDPEEEIDEDDIFGVTSSDDEEPDPDPAQTEQSKNRVTISAGVKDQALKVLSRIPQSIHVVIKQRLEKYPPALKEAEIPSNDKEILQLVLKQTRNISECIDESAEAMYMGDPELCLKKAGEAKALTIEVVESVLQPWNTKAGGKEETKEDKYIQRALIWVQQVSPTSGMGS